MARVSIQDCLERIPNRFAIVMLAARRMRQLQRGSDPLVVCKNKEAVTALREIAAGKVGVKNHKHAAYIGGFKLTDKEDTKR